MCVCDILCIYHGALHSLFIFCQLTIVTSSIFEILRTNMLTRTTAGPSNMANRTNKINQSLSSSQIHRDKRCMRVCGIMRIGIPFETTPTRSATSREMCLNIILHRDAYSKIFGLITRFGSHLSVPSLPASFISFY